MTFDEYRERSYFPALDGLRAICAFGVVAEHMHDEAMFGWLNGDMGVDVFFVISGYIITTLALREERSTGSVSLASFYTRRSMRILPVYYVVLGLFCVLIAMGRFTYGRQAFLAALPSYVFYYQDVEGAYFFQRAYVPQPGPDPGWSPFGHSWTLGVEEKFYLAWPFLAFCLLARRPRRRLAVSSVLLVGFALAQATWRVVDPGNPNSFWPWMLANYFPITMGCLLAQLLDRRDGFEQLRRLGSPLGAAAVATLFASIHFATGTEPFNFHESGLVYSLAATLFLTSIVTGKGRLSQFLGSSPMAWLGRLSYAIYLMHTVFILVVHKLRSYTVEKWWHSIPAYLAVSLLSIAMAYILAITIERPCIALGREWSKRLIENRKIKH